MSKKYALPQIEVIRIESVALMIPNSDPQDPNFLPPGHYVPGPGPSYDPQGSVV